MSSEQAAAEALFAKTIVWLLRVQALMAGAAALVFAVLGGPEQSLAALVGGAIGILLTAVTALRVGISLGRDPRVMIAAFYRAMAFKLVLAAILFVIVAKWFAGYFGPVLTGYIATLVAYWTAMWRVAHVSQEMTQQDE
ncbi:MAG: ATP synthase subunit I [Pseudomonadota bacterium]